MQLKNSELLLELDRFGSIKTISSLRHHRIVCLNSDQLRVSSDFGEWRSKDTVPEMLDLDSGTIEFRYETPLCQFLVTYRLSEAASYFERFLSVIPKQPVTIYQVCSSICFDLLPLEIIDYQTFWNCPTTCFIRYPDYGLFTGFANPCFSTCVQENRMELQFEPEMVVTPEKPWTTESNFWGMHALSGKRIEQQIPKTSIRYNGTDHPRYRNPSGFISLDREEIKSFKLFADHYLDLRVKDFKVIFYNFFSPLPQQPKTKEEEQLYYHYIDNFVRMGGEIITFNPLVRNRPPLPDTDSYWELAPSGSAAERILNYAKAKGLKIGFYMGSAPDNSNYCDSPMAEFASTLEKTSWKKIGVCGEISRENCIADDDFAEWFYQVQKNTIEKYGITLWDWDPGPGNGFFCYSAEHGHVPGKGAYKGFYHAMNLVKRLRETFPELYIQGFHGTKEYGLWGFRGFDQHEAYWEQCPYDGATVYPDLSEDRLTASGMRFQSWWNQTFRFMPAVTNHSLAHRMAQCCVHPRELLYLFDHLGWKYGIMSALAAGASITVPLIPYDPEDIYGGYIPFFKKWSQWGRDHFHYNQHAVAFGEQVVCGTVDGYSKILDGHGFLFLCNSAPIPSEIGFILGEEIGLTVPGEYTFKQIYPLENVGLYDKKLDQGLFHYGETIHVAVPQYEVLVLELQQVQQEPFRLYGINGTVEVYGDTVEILDSSAPEGDMKEGILELAKASAISRLIVNGTDIPFQVSQDKLKFRVQYGDAPISRYLYDWADSQNHPFECPNSRKMQTVELHTSFFASGKMKALMEEARPKNAEQVEGVIPTLKEQMNRNNFAWATPDRLFLAVPFSDANQVNELRISINGVEYEHTHVTVEHYSKQSGLIDYLDITDIVTWEADNEITVSAVNLTEHHFLGAYLYYPPCHNTDLITVPTSEVGQPLASQPLYPLSFLKPWYQQEGRQVRVDAAWINEVVIEELHDYTVCASVNLGPDELEGVYFSAQVCIDQTNSSLSSDEKMDYDPLRKVWKRTLHMGNRQLLIIDGKDIHVWAVTKDHFVSPAYRVKVEWKLF